MSIYEYRVFIPGKELRRTRDIAFRVGNNEDAFAEYVARWLVDLAPHDRSYGFVSLPHRTACGGIMADLDIGGVRP